MCACFIRTSNTNNFNVVSHHCHTFPPCWPALAGHRSWHKVWKWWWNSVEFFFFFSFSTESPYTGFFFFWMTIMYSICLYTSIDLCTRLFYFADVSPGWHQKPPLVHYGMQCSDGPESSGRDGLVVGWYCREALQCRLMWCSLWTADIDVRLRFVMTKNICALLMFGSHHFATYWQLKVAQVFG